MKAVVVASDMITPYGVGIDACWRGILSGRTAVSRVDRFRTASFQSDFAGTVPNLAYHGGESLVMQMLRPLFGKGRAVIPGDAKLVLATTKGEIDFLEMSILHGAGDPARSAVGGLLHKVAALTGAREAASRYRRPARRRPLPRHAREP